MALYPYEKESGVHLRLEEEFGGVGFIAVHETYDHGKTYIYYHDLSNER